MATDPILYAAPLFVVSLLAEGLALRGTGRAYTFRRVTSALGCLAYDQLINAATAVAFMGAYVRLHAAASFAPLGASGGIASGVLGVGVAVLLHDFLYYAYHRLSHRVNVLWAVHVVHHQSRSYDLTVSLRQGTVATWVTYVFYMPMALVASPTLFLYVHAAYQIYQFFVHTELVRRLGFLERFLATPSHHRVHHGTNAAYIDRNYGGFFIVFDRLFGTFAEEREAPKYGVPGGYDNASPGMANLYLFGRLLDLSREARGMAGLLRLWFGPPEATPTFKSDAPPPRGAGSTGAYFAVALGLFLVTAALFVPAGASVRFALGVLAVALMESGYRFLGATRAAI